MSALRFLPLALTAVVFLGACSTASGRPVLGPSVTFAPSRTPSTPTTTPIEAPTADGKGASAASRFCETSTVGDAGPLGFPELSELSGLTILPSLPDVLWGIQDSGSAPTLFAMGLDGEAFGAHTVDSVNLDWEDLAPGPEGTVLIADSGNNLRNRDTITILEVAPPADPRVAGPPLQATTRTYRFPDEPQDLEALLYDPVTEEIYLVSKALDQGTDSLESESVVFRAPTVGAGDAGVLEEVARVQLGLLSFATAGEVSSDGATVVLRTYGQVLVWDRGENVSVPDALTAEPCGAVAPDEAQGESVAIAPGSNDLFTASEGAGGIVHRIASP